MNPDWEALKKLTAKRNQDIVRLRAEGATIAVLAREYRVTRQRIEQILRADARRKRDDSDIRAALNRHLLGAK